MIKIFCKSFPPELGGDGIVAERYLEYGERDALVFTVGNQKDTDRVRYLSESYDRNYVKKARDHICDGDFVWCHSTRLAIDLHRYMDRDDFITVHGLWGLIPRSSDSWFKYQRNRVAEYLFFKFMCKSNVTVVSPYSKRKLDGFVDPFYVPNGVDFSGFKNFKKDKKAVYLGRHHPQKDIGFVTEISKYLVSKGYRVHIGGKTNKYSLQDTWDSIDGLSYGYLDQDEKNRWLRGSKFLIQPSKWEGFPLTLLESLKYKCIPIIRDYSELSSIDLSKYFIFIDKENYKEKIEKAFEINHDFNELEKLLKSKYNWKKIIERYDKLFKKND
ncbi:Glycosyltransferase, AglL family [Methanonatronarchaeum thermophilum]|uniref:Glycosyltransferase, AglL family n=1 Tax=Methanonatronarchaeum thermophilum TaxID=1927129 RepID=A0A1Y3GFB4_9EURY|nr:glycosyltransferase family 4 protein [Methanonatronarchaeum thermophilum]OUJ18076.1 Glycosyltransferase, AglL family [Methanonatronarchaeum thermophilum]